VLDPSLCQPAHVLQATGQRVALALELGKTEDPRAEARSGARAERRVGGDVREERRDGPRQLALQVRDLRAKRAARRTLVELLDVLSAALWRQLLQLVHGSNSSLVHRTPRFYQCPFGTSALAQVHSASSA
jgi:hypothetical protein